MSCTCLAIASYLDIGLHHTKPLKTIQNKNTYHYVVNIQMKLGDFSWIISILQFCLMAI